MILWLARRQVARNLHRLLGGAFATSLAAALLAFALSVEQGHAPGVADVPRRFLGGDILVFADRAAFAADDAGHPGRWRWTPWRIPWDSDLDALLPGLERSGTLEPGPPSYLDVDRVRRAAAGHPDVAGAYPAHLLPAFLLAPDGRRLAAPLRGRDLDADRDAGFDGLVIAGRYFTDADRGRPVALVHGVRNEPFYPYLGMRPPFAPPPVGTEITLLLPRVRGYAGGAPVYDFSALDPVRLTVVGHFALPVTEGLARSASGRVLVNPDTGETWRIRYYWETNQVLVPRETYQALAARLGADPGRAREVAVRVRDPLRVRAVAAWLRPRLPGTAVVPVADLVPSDPVRRLPTPLPLPPDLGPVAARLAVLAAGIILAGNLTLLLAQRRRELAVLRALGASALEVAGLVLAELLLVTLGGALAGVLVARALVTLTLVAAGWDAAAIAADTLKVAGTVLATAAGAALLAGLLPVAEAARTPVAEVLREA